METPPDLIHLTVRVVASFAGHNTITAAELPTLPDVISISDAARLIQTALTPVFMLSAIGMPMSSKWL